MSDADMSAQVEAPQPTVDAAPGPPIRLYVQGALLGIGVLAAYWRSMSWVTNLTLLHVDTGGGLFAPLISGWLVWRERDELRGLPVRGTHWGLIALAVGALLFAGGLWGRFASVLTVSLVIVIWGLVAWLGGIELGRRLLFPIAYLAFVVPAPSLLDRLSLPLRLFATKVSALLPMALGMDVRVEGTEMIVDNFRTMIDTPCSGLSYLLALLAAALLVAYLSECSLGRKIWLSLSAIPIAVLANIVRIEMTFLLHETVGDVFSAGVGHFLVGMVVIAFATLSLLGVWAFTCRESTDAS